MKKWLFLFALLLPLLSVGQRTIQHSWDGHGLYPKAHIRTLNIFANIIFDVDSTMDPEWDSPYWHKITDTSLAGVNIYSTYPSYLLDYMDTIYVPGQTHGTMTRVFGESSFDSLQITGDFVVVNLLQSRMYNKFGQGNVFSFDNILILCVEMINETGGLSTIFGHNRRYDYAQSDTDLYFTNFYIRNTSSLLGGKDHGCGVGSLFSTSNLLNSTYLLVENEMVRFSGKGSMQCVGSFNFGMNPTGVATHEIGHSLFGHNNFHTSGGNHRVNPGSTMPWMNIQGGYGLMGAAGSSLVSCNGYDRWRMHWKHPSSPYYICARNAMNNGFLNSDISKADGNKWFLLRDFVTYGDAVRIKLPYKDSTITPNQYIWLEFHNVGNNDKLDFLQHTVNDTCLHQASSGIYAYYQIGRDVLEGTSVQVWDSRDRDNLRIISNEGYWDYVQYPLAYDTDFVCTGWNWDSCYYVPEYSNAFCGYQDQETFIVPKWYDADLGNTCDTLYMTPLRYDNYSLKYKIREYTARNMIKDGEQENHNIIFNGDAHDAFSSHRKLNMGTNPSTCNAKTCYTSNTHDKTKLTFSNSQYNNTTTYLTGLSIEMIPLGDTLWAVMVRWDDYDITNDARWTGKIVLKGTEQVNLTRGNSITLAQNRTPAQRLRSTESGYFAEPTQLTCEAGSHFIQQPQTSLVLTEKSLFVLDSGATYHLGDSAQILVQGKSSFTIRRGADFTGGIASEIVVDSLSTLYVYDTARLRLESRIIIRPGGKLIVNGGTLTSACDGEMWEGIIVEGDVNQRQYASKQGSVLLTNATIENARTAIRTRGADDATQWDKTGGIVQATNTLFRNNRRAAEFLTYENHTSGNAITDNVSYFTRCTFTINDDNLFAANAATFDAHVTLLDVRGVKFNGCTFRNEVTTTADSARGSAILSLGAGFKAKRVCPQLSNLDPCACYPSGSDTVTRCTFEGFFEAVNAANTDGQHDITIDNCDFSHNHTGVRLAVADNARVSFCDFDLSDISSQYGVSLANSTGFTVEGNSFHRHSASYLPSVGVACSNTGAAENVVRLNSFTNLFPGCYATGTNAERTRPAIPGLQFGCNSFTGCINDISAYSAQIRGTQGSSSAGADNSFTGTTISSIALTTTNTIHYWYHNVSGHAPISPSTGVTTHDNATANSCGSSLCGNQLPPGPRSGAESLAQYRMLAEEMRTLYDTLGNRPDDPQDVETAALQMQLSDLSAAMGDLARTALRAILSDTAPDLALLKEWYGTMVGTFQETFLPLQEQYSTIPVAAYQLAEVYSTEGDYAAADALLASLPQRFNPDEPSRNEYDNYQNLQRLRENVAGNWYRQTDAEIADLQQVADYDDGRAARMAKEILCFFHHICYEDEPLPFFDGGAIGERGYRRDAVHHVSTPDAAGLRLHPNPANTTLTVESDSPVREITIYDLTGRTMLTVNVRANDYSPLQTLNISSLPAGIYLLRAVTDNGVKTARFVKN